MTVKVEAAPSPVRLTPGERLARKRAAARTRQQRCRSRKREVLLEERRQNTEGKRTDQNQDSIEHLLHDHRSVPHFPSERSPRETEYWGENIGTTGPIHHCVSFETQRSFEEPQKPHERAQSPGSPLGKQNQCARTVLSPVAPSSSVPKKSSCSSEQGKGSATMSEEAAVAAMLSLKTGPNDSSTNNSSPIYRIDSHFRGHGVKVPRVAKHRGMLLPRPWEPRQFHHFQHSRRPIRVPQYRPIPQPPPPMQRYPYYPSYERYERFRYE